MTKKFCKFERTLYMHPPQIFRRNIGEIPHKQYIFKAIGCQQYSIGICHTLARN